jgi:hypothetical protein
MIPVQLQPEPSDFNSKVRIPGSKFLQTNPSLTGRDAWKNREYWQKSLEDLYNAYNHICSYTAIWIQSPPEGQRSVDHFVPKSHDPSQAYEWSNFRLTSVRMNTWKDIHQDILDPFQIGNDWFFLNFFSLEIHPNPDLTWEQQEAILATTKRLKLNEKDCIKTRQNWLNDYCFSHKSLGFLEKRAPFIAHELKRQGYTQKIIDVWERAQASKAT